MVWTAPKAWGVSELVTAANMNTHVRDNLKYLKGQAGTVAIEADITITNNIGQQITMIHSGGTIKDYRGVTSSGLGLWDVNRSNASGTFDDTAKSHARITLDPSGTASSIQFATASAANTAATEVVRIAGDGKVGFGTAAPQGRLHSYDAISGFLKWEFDGVDGTARTVIPNGAGDVLYRLAGISVVRASDGTTQAYSDFGAIGTPTPGGTFDIYAAGAGANKCTVTVNANGSVTVARSAGSLTYKVSLLLTWL